MSERVIKCQIVNVGKLVLAETNVNVNASAVKNVNVVSAANVAAAANVVKPANALRSVTVVKIANVAIIAPARMATLALAKSRTRNA